MAIVKSKKVNRCTACGNTQLKKVAFDPETLDETCPGETSDGFECKCGAVLSDPGDGVQRHVALDTETVSAKPKVRMLGFAVQ